MRDGLPVFSRAWLLSSDPGTRGDTHSQTGENCDGVHSAVDETGVQASQTALRTGQVFGTCRANERTGKADVSVVTALFRVRCSPEGDEAQSHDRRRQTGTHNLGHGSARTKKRRSASTSEGVTLGSDSAAGFEHSKQKNTRHGEDAQHHGSADQAHLITEARRRPGTHRPEGFLDGTMTTRNRHDFRYLRNPSSLLSPPLRAAKQRAVVYLLRSSCSIPGPHPSSESSSFAAA